MAEMILFDAQYVLELQKDRETLKRVQYEKGMIFCALETCMTFFLWLGMTDSPIYKQVKPIYDKYASPTMDIKKKISEIMTKYDGAWKTLSKHMYD